MSTAVDRRCSVTLLRDPLRLDRTRQAVPCSVGQWLSEVVPSECAVGEWVAVDAGKVIPREQWDRHLLVPGSEILLYPRATGTVGKIVSGIVFPPLGVYWALRAAGMPSWASGLLTGGPIGMQFFPSIENIMSGRPSAPANKPTTNSDLNSSPTYGFSGITNSTRIGAPIPVVYGVHRVGGQLIGFFVQTQNDSDVLHMLVALSEGVVHAIGEVEVNEQPIANYGSVSYQYQLGGNAQPTMGLFGDKGASTISVDAGITTTIQTYTTQGDTINAFALKLTFPGGLYQLDSNGNFQSRAVVVEVDWKLSSSGTWTIGPRATFRDNRRVVLRREVRIDSLAAGRYDIRWRRTTVEASSNTEVDAVRAEAVTEIVNDAYIYPNTAVLGVQALASNQLSGGIPRVTALVHGVQVKQFAANLTYSVAYSQNPAWIVFDILSNARYGHGRFTWRVTFSAGTLTVTNGSVNFSGSGTGWTAATLRRGDLLHDPVGQAVGIVKTVNYGAQTGTFYQVWGGASRSNGAYEVRANDLDIPSFVEWAAFCDALVPNGTGATEPRCQCSLVFDAEGENIWSAVLRVCGIGQASIVKMGNSIRVRVEKPEAPVQLVNMANIKADTFEEVFLPLRERSNLFEVQFLNAANGYRQDMVVLEDPLLFTNSEQPRRKTISGYGITRSSQAARLARYNQRVNRYVTRTITFEMGLDAVGFEPGDVFRFQHDVPQWGFGGRALAGATSNTIVLDREVTVAPSTLYEILVRHADDTVETQYVATAPGTVSTLTITGSWTQTPAQHDLWAFGEVFISTKPFRAITIERTQELEARITAVEYVEAVYDETGLNATNEVQYSALADLMGPPGQVKDLTILEQPGVELSVWVSFSPPGSANFKTANIYRTDSGAPVLLGSSSTGSFPVSGLRGGEFFEVRVTSVSSLGGESDYNAAPVASIVVAQVNPPDVPTLVLEGDRLRWNYPNPPRDLAGFVVRFRPGTSLAWESATPAHNGVLLATDLQIFRRQGIQTFLVKAVDTFGNESVTAKHVTVSFDAAETENIVIATDHRALGWPGTVSGASLISGDLRADASAVFWTSDTAVMWSSNPTTTMWTAAYSGMTYEVTIQPTADLLDAMLKLPITMAGEWAIEYLPESSALMWSANSGTPMWSNDSAAAWSALGNYTQWPGQLDHLRAQQYKIRVVGYAGTEQAILQQLSVVYDVPDLVEILNDVPISAAGTRLALTKTYREIVSARVTLEDDGGSAAYAKVMDKSLAGPLIKTFTSSDVATTGLVDVVVHGY